MPDKVTVRTRKRERGGFATAWRIERMTVAEARELYLSLRGNTYANTKPGQYVWLSVGGTLTQIGEVYQEDWREIKSE
jgi:hypothetical protein